MIKFNLLTFEDRIAVLSYDHFDFQKWIMNNIGGHGELLNNNTIKFNNRIYYCVCNKPDVYGKKFNTYVVTELFMVIPNDYEDDILQFLFECYPNIKKLC